MNIKYFVKTFLVIIFGSLFVSGQEITVTCEFGFTQQIFYTCSLPGLIIADDLNQNIIFDVSGHVEGRNNSDVTRATVYGGSVPFIITQFFKTFPNLRLMAISPSGLLRIQSYAFSNANNLEQFASYRNPLAIIEADAFAGAPRLNSLDLYDNAIASIDNTAFNELGSLQYLNIGGNNLSTLNNELFKPLVNLTHFSVALNQIAVLSRNLFANNQLLQHADFFNNRINAIGGSLLDGLNSLTMFDMRGNLCANSFWIIDEETTIQTILEGLETCFANYVEPPQEDVRKFILELRGSLVIRDENGTEIVRL